MTEDRRATVEPAKAEASRAGGSAPDTVPAVLRAAADLIEPPGKWVQGFFGDPETGCCAVGAIIYAAGDDDNAYFACVAAMERLLGNYASIWNDTEGRTQVEVVAALRKAADLAEAAGTTDPLVSNNSSAQEPEAASVLTPSKTGQTL